MVHKMPMQSTGGEKFMVYIYFKSELYDPEQPWSDSDSEASEYSVSDIDDYDDYCTELKDSTEKNSSPQISPPQDQLIIEINKNQLTTSHLYLCKKQNLLNGYI